MLVFTYNAILCDPMLLKNLMGDANDNRMAKYCSASFREEAEDVSVLLPLVGCRHVFEVLMHSSIIPSASKP